MRVFWENEGNANDEGEYVASVDTEDGKPAQRFIGKSHKDVADRLLDAQAHATTKIRELRARVPREAEAAKPATEFSRKPLTADARHRVAQDLARPDTAPEAIAQVIESEFGQPLEVVRKRLNEEEEERAKQQAFEGAKAFADSTPDWFPSQHNLNTLGAYMETHKMALTQQNFTMAFEDLKEANLLQMRPTTPAATAEEKPEESAARRSASEHSDDGVRVRPRGAGSSGLRAGDSSTAAPVRTQPRTRYTRDEIERMPRTEYSDRYKSDPTFRAEVDRLYTSPAAR